MNPITSWRDAALRLHAHSEPILLTHPQPDFRYPAFPALSDNELADPIAALKTSIDVEHPEAVQLADDLTSALRQWLRSSRSNGARVMSVGPPPAELVLAVSNVNGTLFEGSREPGALFDANEPTPTFIHLANPNRIDGFFYPQEMFESVYREIRAAAPDAHLLVDESLTLFSFNQIAPGTLKKRPVAASDTRLTFLGGVYPAMSPQGPEVAWTIASTSSRPGPSAAVSAAIATEALRAHAAFRSRQGKAAAEFSRRMLAVDRGMRTLAVHVQRESTRGNLTVPVWPESGFHLVLELGERVALGPDGIEGFCLEAFAKTGLLFIPGTLFGRPRSFALCYAARPTILEEAGRRLEAVFKT